MEELRKKIKDVMQEPLKDFIETNNLSFESNLDESGVDSITFVQLLIHLEDEFDVEFDDEKLAKTDFKKLDELVEYVITLVNA